MIRNAEPPRRCRVESTNHLQSPCGQESGSTPTRNQATSDGSNNRKLKAEEDAKSEVRKHHSAAAVQGSNKNKTRKPTEKQPQENRTRTEAEEPNKSNRSKHPKQKAQHKPCGAWYVCTLRGSVRCGRLWTFSKAPPEAPFLPVEHSDEAHNSRAFVTRRNKEATLKEQQPFFETLRFLRVGFLGFRV